jgi:hypothetical protein
MLTPGVLTSPTVHSFRKEPCKDNVVSLVLALRVGENFDQLKKFGLPASQAEYLKRSTIDLIMGRVGTFKQNKICGLAVAMISEVYAAVLKPNETIPEEILNVYKYYAESVKYATCQQKKSSSLEIALPANSTSATTLGLSPRG